MRKKILFSMFAAVGLLAATSCQEEAIFTEQVGDEATVSFSVQLKDAVGTRAISDGLTADKLIVTVYDENRKELKTIRYEKNGAFSNREAIVTFNLVKGQTYSFAFWAQNHECTAYTYNYADATVTVDYTGSNNDESRDAFYAQLNDYKVSGDFSKPITLTRPFAQLNFGVTDWKKAIDAGITVETSEVVVTEVPTQLNLLDKSVDGDTTVTYTPAKLPQDSLMVDLNGDKTKEAYQWLSMSYLLAEEAGNVSDITFTFANNNQPIVVKSANTPLKRNWRTNIIGQLTNSGTFVINIDTAYVDDENIDIISYPVSIVNGGRYKTIEEALAQAVDGDVITLVEGVFTLPESIRLKDNAQGHITFEGSGENTMLRGSAGANGNNITMKNLTWTSPSKGYDTAFTGAASVVFDHCNIIGQYYAQSFAPHTFTDCTIDPQTGYLYTYDANCTFERCTFNSSEGKALQVYADASGKESTITITNCTFKAAKHAQTFDGKPVTAIDINSTNGNKFNVNITNTTATGYATGLFSGNDLWNIKGGEENVVITIGDETVYPYIALNDKYYHTLDAALAVAVDNDVIEIRKGTYAIPSNAKGKTVTFRGAKNTDVVISDVNSFGNLNSSTVTFENLTIESIKDNYKGFTHIAEATYKNCILRNQFTLYGPSKFDECTFEIDGDYYNVWTYGTNSEFTNCTFNCDGKAVLVYTENNDVDDTVTFNSCTFNDKGGLVDEKKAAIETGANAATVKHTLKINGKTTVNGFAQTGKKSDLGGDSLGDTLWGNKNLMTRENLNVFVNGDSVY